MGGRWEAFRAGKPTQRPRIEGGQWRIRSLAAPILTAAGGASSGVVTVDMGSSETRDR